MMEENQPTPTPGKGISLWIIEDSDAYREKLDKIFELEGAVDCQASFASYEEACEYLKDHEIPEVILIDLNLPGTQGIDAIRELKLKYPMLQTLVLTVAGNRRSVFDALRAGAAGYLLKNEPFDRIVEHILSVAQGGVPLSNAVTPYFLDVLKSTPAPMDVSELSEQELEILGLLADGLSRKEAADKMSLATVTIDYHLQSIYRKLKVHSVAGAIVVGFRKGWLK